MYSEVEGIYNSYQRMNILFLNISSPNPVLGGVSCVAYHLYKYFKSKGHKVTVLAWSKTATNYDDNADYVYMPECDNVLSDANCAAVKDLLQREHVDVVMNHTCLTPKYAVVLEYFRSYGCRIVSVVHSSLFGIYGLRFSMRNFGTSGIRRLLDRGTRIFFYLKYHRQWRMAAENSDRVVMLSDKFIPEFQYFAGGNFAGKITSMPNPVTVEDEPRVRKENRLVFVGRLSIEKGLNYLLDIWSLLEEKHPDWQLDIVGDGAERTFVESRIKTLGLSHCTMYGFQKAEPYYNRAKIFCMTSYYEGFGLVLVEAMHFGTIPFAFRSYANVGDIIEDGESGFLIPPFDVEQYADKLSNLMDDSSLLDAMSKRAVAKSKEFALEVIGAKWEKMFEEVVEN